MKPLTTAIIGALVVAVAVFGYLYYQRTSNDIIVEGSTPVTSGAQKAGDCAITTIMRITARLEGTSAHDTGSAIVYANGVSGVSYEYVPPLHASRIGDQVRLCLVSIDKNYPLGGELGQEYQATNLRTGNHWVSSYSSDYIRQIAPYYGVDSNAAIAIFNKETGGDSNFIGDMGSSFGPFQLHYGGMVPGVPRLNNPGLGDEFTAVTGLNASDPSTWQAQVGFSLYEASTRGFNECRRPPQMVGHRSPKRPRCIAG